MVAWRRVVDAITGTEEAAYKSLGEKDRQTVVRNVLKWGEDGHADTLEAPWKSFDLCSCRETDLNRTGQISLAEFKQMVVRYASCISLVFVFELCRFCLTHVWKNLLTNPIDQVPRLRQQLQNQALDYWIANLYKHVIKCYFPHVVFINHQQSKIVLVDPGISGLRAMGPDVDNWETFVRLKWLNLKFMRYLESIVCYASFILHFSSLLQLRKSRDCPSNCKAKPVQEFCWKGLKIERGQVVKVENRCSWENGLE